MKRQAADGHDQCRVDKRSFPSGRFVSTPTSLRAARDDYAREMKGGEGFAKGCFGIGHFHSGVMPRMRRALKSRCLSSMRDKIRAVNYLAPERQTRITQGRFGFVCWCCDVSHHVNNWPDNFYFGLSLSWERSRELPAASVQAHRPILQTGLWIMSDLNVDALLLEIVSETLKICRPRNQSSARRAGGNVFTKLAMQTQPPREGLIPPMIRRHGSKPC